jgi:O-antigen/teichoic acid export membrane protein
MSVEPTESKRTKEEHPYKKFLTEVIWVGLAQFLPMIKGFIIFPLITKTLGAESYGIYSQILVTIGLISPFALLGLPTAMMRFLPGEKGKHRLAGTFWAALSIIAFNGLLLLIGLYFVSPYLIKSVFKTEYALSLLRIAAILIPVMTVNQTLLWYFVTFEQSKKYTFFNVTNDVLFVSLIIYFLLQGKGILAIILTQIFVTAVVSGIALSTIVRQIGVCRPQFSNLRRYFSLGFPLFVGGYAYWAIHSADRYIIGYFMNIKSVGIYSGVYNLSMIIIALSGPIYFVLLPKVSGLWENGEISEVKKYFRYSTKYFLMIGIPSVFGMSLLGKDLLTALATAEFTSAWILIPLITSSMLIFQTLTVVGYVYNLAEKTIVTMIAASLAAVENIILNIIMVPILGVLGAAVATLITYISYGIGYFWFSRRYLKLKIDISFAAKSLIASTIMGAAILKIDSSGVIGLLSAILLGAVIYTTSILLLKGFDKKEIELVKSFLSKSR